MKVYTKRGDAGETDLIGARMAQLKPPASGLQKLKPLMRHGHPKLMLITSTDPGVSRTRPST